MIKRSEIWRGSLCKLGITSRRALEIADRERQLESRDVGAESSAMRKLREENHQLRQQISDLNLQMELQSRSSSHEFATERESYRRRALELTKREQAILERERETDELHSEALRLNQEAKEKSNEAERVLYSKRKYVDDLENARKQVASREAELNDLERIKDGANSIELSS